MTQSPFIRAEEAQRKGFDFSPWGGLEGFLKASQAGALGNTSMLKRMVPDLAHAVDMTAVAISSLPFEIIDDSIKEEGKALPPPPDKPAKPADSKQPKKEVNNVFDTSTDWQNKLGGMENPQRLLYLIASSLCGGAAYVIPTRTPRMIFDLQYAAPYNVQIQYGNGEILRFFHVTQYGGTTEPYNPNQILHFFLPDSDVEIGPALNHPLGNASLDASMVWAMKNTLKTYGDRGFVPITLLGAKGMPASDERVKAENFFDRLLRGGFDVLAKIVNADALELIRVGAGMDELKQSYLEIRRDAKESIADSFGIPTALFMSDNAFASEMDVLRKQWYSSSRFVTIYQTIQEVFSEQLFKQYNKSMRFALETLDIFQEDETKRAASLGQIVTAITTDPATAKLGMEILGYDLDEEQEAALDEIISTKEADKLQQQDMQAKQMEQDAQLAREGIQAKQQAVGNQPPARKPFQKPAPKSLTADEMKDIALWYSKSKAWFVAGKGAAVDWENKHLSEEIAAPIRLKLAEAKSEYDIMQAFVIGETQTPAPEYERATWAATDETIKALVDVIEKAIEQTK